MTEQRSRALLLAVAAFTLGLTWLAVRPAAPPLYDGLQLPQEPYRYLNSNPPAGNAHTLLKIAGNASPITVASTGESPPQARMFLEYNALHAPKGTRQVALTIDPVPTTSQPPGSHIDGNVYAFSIRGVNGEAISVATGPGVTIELRGTGESGRPTIDRFAGGKWTPQGTVPIPSSNTYLARVHELGQFALVLPGTKAAGNGSPILLFVIGGVVVLLLLVVGLLLIRSSRNRAAAG